MNAENIVGCSRGYDGGYVWRLEGCSRKLCEDCPMNLPNPIYLSESGHESKASAMQSDPCAPVVGTRQAETSFYSQRFQDFSRISPWILDTVRFKDEAWFQVSGYVNSPSSRIWAAENPWDVSGHTNCGSIFCEVTVITTVYIHIYNISWKSWTVCYLLKAKLRRNGAKR
jgi:hypothetical protein